MFKIRQLTKPKDALTSMYCRGVNLMSLLGWMTAVSDDELGVCICCCVLPYRGRAVEDEEGAMEYESAIFGLARRWTIFVFGAAQCCLLKSHDTYQFLLMRDVHVLQKRL